MAEKAVPPSGTITLLFTDIEGSTRMLLALGERYADALADHRRILRDVWSECGGTEMDTQGDSFFVVFPRASDALAAATKGQRRLAAHPWPGETPLRVRMGIHTGEPTLSGGDYVGIDVHRAARIAAAGHGGQVLVSRSPRSSRPFLPRSARPNRWLNGSAGGSPTGAY
jgi:class 3 adenylate cyclase